MSLSLWQKRTMARLSRLAEIIRAEKHISFADLCLKGSIPPSTLHAYKQMLLSSHKDLEYEDGEFRVKKV